jgi:hypothetical protein
MKLCDIWEEKKGGVFCGETRMEIFLDRGEKKGECSSFYLKLRPC